MKKDQIILEMMNRVIMALIIDMKTPLDIYMKDNNCKNKKKSARNTGGYRKSISKSGRRSTCESNRKPTGDSCRKGTSERGRTAVIKPERKSSLSVGLLCFNGRQGTSNSSQKPASDGGRRVSHDSFKLTASDASKEAFIESDSKVEIELRPQTLKRNAAMKSISNLRRKSIDFDSCQDAKVINMVLSVIFVSRTGKTLLLLPRSFNQLQRDFRIVHVLCCGDVLNSSSFVYSAKYTMFVPRFLESYSLFGCYDNFNSEFSHVPVISYFSFCNLCPYFHRSFVTHQNMHFHFERICHAHFLQRQAVRFSFPLTLSSSTRIHCFNLTIKHFFDFKMFINYYLSERDNCLYNEKVVKLSEKLSKDHFYIVSRQFYGDVDLQTKNYESDKVKLCTGNEQVSSNLSKEMKSMDNDSDSLKRTLRNNTEMPDEKCVRHDNYIVAPVTKPKKKNKHRPSQSDDRASQMNSIQNGISDQLNSNHNEISDQLNSSHNGISDESSPTSFPVLENESRPMMPREDDNENDRGPVIKDNGMSHVQIDGAQCLSHSNSMALQDGIAGKNTSDGACVNEFMNQSKNDNFSDDTLKANRRCVNLKESAGNYAANVNTEMVVGQSLAAKALNSHSLQENAETNLPRRDIEPQLDGTETENSSPSAVTVATDSNSHSMYPLIADSDIQRFEPMMDIIDKIASGERVPPQTTMRYEMLRFCTLRSFPKENKPFITKIAAAGFYYANTGDEVVCYTCARRKNNWRENDDPMEIHRQLNPSCAFLLRNLEVNVPVKASILSNNSRSSGGRSVSSPHNVTVAPTSQNLSTTNATNNDDTRTNNNVSSSDATSTTNSGILQSSASRTGILNENFRTDAQFQQNRAHGNFIGASPVSMTEDQHLPAAGNSGNQQGISPLTASGSQSNHSASLAKYPRYASKLERLQSYHDCGSIVIPPDSLATAGFFYAGFGDCVRCFQCGVGLRHWSEEDDPWIEHSRWSKDCLFVRQVRGQEFVNLVQMAVQYSQTQSSNGESRTHTPEANSCEANTNNIESLMQTDAAQSVLEMGYHPDIIRRALRAIKDANSQATLSATSLMEKIFEIEDSDAISSPQQNEVSPLELQNTNPGVNNSNSRPESSTRADSTTGHTGERNTGQRHSSAENASYTHAPSIPLTEGSGEVVSTMSTNRSGSLPPHSRKKAQLLEQKKLKEENEQLKQQSLCTKCKKNDVCIVFLPCGHLVTCETCAPTVKYCSVEGCGKYIKGTVRTYLG